MGERKVLNKYYPPDFFTNLKNLPKMKVPKDQHHVIRIMAPFTMRCLTCGEYIYRGRKFNARMEAVKGDDYLGMRIFRFYIRCPKCLTDITYKTDPQSEDYVAEHGAFRTFQAERLAQMEAEKVKQEREEEEANNPMKALEHRTKESRHEMDVLDALEELRDLNARNAHVDFQQLMEKHLVHEKTELQRQETEDEALVQATFHSATDAIVKRLSDADSSDEDQDANPESYAGSHDNSAKEATEVLLEAKGPAQTDNSTIGPTTSTKAKLLSCLVKRKTASNAPSPVVTSDMPPRLVAGIGLVGDYSDSSDSS